MKSPLGYRKERWNLFSIALQSYHFGLFLSIYLFDRKSGRDRWRDREILSLLDHMAVRSYLWNGHNDQGWARPVSEALPWWWHGSKSLVNLLMLFQVHWQGGGLKAEQDELEPVLRWMLAFHNSHFTCCIRILCQCSLLFRKVTELLF